MNEAVLSEITLKLLAVGLIGWLLVAVISLVVQVWTKEKQSFRIPWWSVGALAIAMVLVGLETDYEILIVGVGMGLYALYMAFDTKLGLFAEYKWWNRNRPRSDADEEE